jgi:hypothetical protein
MTKKTKDEVRVQVPLRKSVFRAVNELAVRNNRTLGREAAEIIGLHVSKPKRK